MYHYRAFGLNLDPGRIRPDSPVIIVYFQSILRGCALTISMEAVPYTLAKPAGFCGFGTP
jgi:hypothetical protein